MLTEVTSAVHIWPPYFGDHPSLLEREGSDGSDEGGGSDGGEEGEPSEEDLLSEDEEYEEAPVAIGMAASRFGALAMGVDTEDEDD